MAIITVKILSQDNESTELGAVYEGKEILIDPCVGCAIPFSIFRDYDFIGKTYTFDGDYYKEDNTVFLADEMYDPID